MFTRLAPFVRQRPEAGQLSSIVEACVHCGFCNATCPTYQVLGDELDGPRGRIYLLKQMLEGQPAGELTRRHLDRCLSCRSCESTCPSGVRYSRLLDVGRYLLEQGEPRPMIERIQRQLICRFFPYRRRFSLLLSAAKRIRPMLPRRMAGKLPHVRQPAWEWPQQRHQRIMLIMSGCVQPVLAPTIDTAAAVVLDRLGICLLPVANSGCCGALPYHLSAHEQAKKLARQNIDACWPLMEQGAEAIVMTASGCGVTAKDYGELLQFDPQYREKARVFAEKVKDIGEVLENEDIALFFKQNRGRLAFQSPCTLQHGQKLGGTVESILRRVGFSLTEVADGHLCCGSAGVYSELQPELADRLRQDKMDNLLAEDPAVIATANIGCLNHIQQATGLRVVHWIELLAEQATYCRNENWRIQRWM